MFHRLPGHSGTLLLLLATPAFSQFAQLAATDDGSQLYFTSQLLLKGATSTSTSPFPEAVLYRFGPDGVTLFADRGALASQNTGSSGDGVANPQVSGDGSIVGFTLRDVCIPDPNCMPPGDEGEIRGQQTLDVGPGMLQLSHNGQWAMLTRTILSDPGVHVGPTYASTLINLNTSEPTDLPAPLAQAEWSLASDGTVLLHQGTSWGLWKQGQFSPISYPPDLFGSLTLTDDATKIMITGFFRDAIPAKGAPVLQLMTFDIASGNLTTVATIADAMHQPIRMGASTDGTVMLYRVNRTGTRNGTAYFADTTTGESTSINLPDGEFVSDGTLTGLGDMAFLVTTSGRIVKVTRSTGAIDALFPATPWCDATSPAAIGSLAYLPCNISGSASDLQGQILINGLPVPVLYAQSGAIDIQVPWEIRNLISSTLTLLTPNDSPFSPSQPITLLNSFPRFLAGDPNVATLFGLDIAKGDGSGPLTTQPGPGDTVILYMSGLGPVRNAEQTGVPASLTTPNPITGTITCRFQPQKEDAQTVFAGLAPGAIGIYQVTLRLPADAGAAPVTGLSCGLQTAGGGGAVSVGALGAGL